MMSSTDVDWTRRRPALPVRLFGFSVVLFSVLGLGVGLLLVESFAADLNASVRVSQSAMGAISETIAVVDEVADGTTRSLTSASRSVSSVSETVGSTAETLEGVASFIEDDLPGDLESIREAFPAAIQAASAMDTAMRALSLFGVDYDPEEPFAESLRKVELALAELPSELRSQSEAMRRLIPSANELAVESLGLGADLESLSSSMEGFRRLTEDYQAILDEAEITIEETSVSLGAQTWLFRVLVVLTALVGVLIGFALLWLARWVEVVAETEAYPASRSVQ